MPRNAYLLTALLTLLAAATAARAGTTPQIGSLSDSTLPRSGRLLIFGSGFGATQGTGGVTIGGLDAIATTWSSTEIHAYLPEGTATGTATVQVITAGGSSNAAMLDVTLRQPEGRLRWRFQTDRYTPLQHVTVAPDGTIYTSDRDNVYALGPDGGLLWIAQGAGGGRPISLGADGTIYTGGSLSEGLDGRIVKALNPDGSLRWEITSATGLNLLAGPSVGPDGNIYAVQDSSSGQGLGQFSVDPDGGLRFSQLQFVSFVGGNSEITFGDGQFYASWETNASGPLGIHAFDSSNGNLLWDGGDVGVSANGLPILDAQGRLMLGHAGSGLVAVTADGDPVWIAAHPTGTNTALQPTMGVSDVWAVGQYRIIGAGTPGYHAATYHWDGSSWSYVPNPAETLCCQSTDLNTVAGVAADDVWAAGSWGIQPLFMHWDGSSWTIVPGPAGATGNVYEMVAIASDDVWAVDALNGTGLGKFYHWDGTAWSIVLGQEIPGAVGVERHGGLAAVGPCELWAVGSYNFGTNPVLPLIERLQPQGGLPADVNGDGTVDVNDLIAVITAWGPCPGCPEDADGSGAVDVNDLVMVITNWG